MTKRFILTTNPDIIASDGAGNFGPSLYNISLSLCEGFAVWQAAFRQFSIRKVVMKFVPIATVNPHSGAGTPFQRGTLYTSHNPFGDPAPSMNVLSGYPDTKITHDYRPHTRVVIPPVLGEVFESALLTDYTIKRRPWLRTQGGDTVPHYCIYYGGEGFVWGLPVYKLFTYVYVKFRQPV